MEIKRRLFTKKLVSEFFHIFLKAKKFVVEISTSSEMDERKSFFLPRYGRKSRDVPTLVTRNSVENVRSTFHRNAGSIIL